MNEQDVRLRAFELAQSYESNLDRRLETASKIAEFIFSGKVEEPKLDPSTKETDQPLS